MAFACLLLVAGTSSVQAVHLHGHWLPHQAAQVGAAADGSQLPGGENRCPLCVAMHSALPVRAHVEPTRLVVMECRLAQGVNHAPVAAWHFAMFSRPPPVVTP